MQYSLANHTLSTSNASLPWIWPGHGTGPTRDGITTLEGDTISPDLDGSLVVLSFALGILIVCRQSCINLISNGCIGSVGCWVSLIMVEQLIYNATKRVEWMQWAIACAIAHGGGTWTMHLIAMGNYFITDDIIRL